MVGADARTTDDPVPSGQAGPEAGTPRIPLPSREQLPAVIPPKPTPVRRHHVAAAVLLILAALGAGLGWYGWRHRLSEALPAGIVSGNGRIEAEPTEIATKIAGRLAEVLVDEGDMVHVGQVLARMDAREIEAALSRVRAQANQAQRALEGRRASFAQQQSTLRLAEAELARTQALVQQGFATRQVLDQRNSTREVAASALAVATAQIAEAEAALQASAEAVHGLEVQLSDTVLTSPVEGRVQYRLARPGEVLGAGGRVLTVLDVTYVYMAVFLPTGQAGQAAIGAEARLVLDAYPGLVIPARVTFLSPQAQFTPKAVETRTERERLVFRVKLRIDPELLRAHAAEVRTGLPGVGYVRLDPAVEWPASLRPSSPQPGRAP